MVYRAFDGGVGCANGTKVSDCVTFVDSSSLEGPMFFSFCVTAANSSSFDIATTLTCLQLNFLEYKRALLNISVLSAS